jgi:phytoene desaturase
MARLAIIGSGFSGLSAACYLSAAGHEVHVFEKNAEAGGRARQLKAGGYVFDMGPSWYWMPSVYEKFFNDFGHTVKDFYQLELLDPSFDVIYPGNEKVSIPASWSPLCELFESIEKGSASKLEKFMKEAKFKYETGMDSLVYKTSESITEFLDSRIITGALRLQVFSSFSKHVRKYFTHPKLISLMEFPVLFLGAMPEDTPALYSLMNYAGLKLGTWYPIGGFGVVADAMVKLAERKGVYFHFNSNVNRINVAGKKIYGIVANEKTYRFDGVVASADYFHVEDQLLPEAYRNYKKEWWDNKILAPSCLIYYIGLNKKLPGLNHHTLFFDESLDEHAHEIYRQPQWPTKPLFYLCNPSKTDHTVAPEGHENLFFLMPLAAGLDDNEVIREKYFLQMLSRLEKQLSEKDLAAAIDYKKSYCVNDFVFDYNSFKGNAYGLANTLNQTAMFKPRIRNKKLVNLFYAGQLTVPGPGVPPSIISGKIAAGELMKYLKSVSNEVVVR